MAWTYPGNPKASDKDKYRFLISDTNPDEPILQDEEIQFILDSHSSHNSRLYHLYETAANVFARSVKRSLGPQQEDPTERQRHFEKQAEYYRKLSSASGLSVPTHKGTKTFSKGMHDNV